MVNREELLQILLQAKEGDPKYELFGSDEHKYGLNPPIEEAKVREIEKEHGFTLPEDYFAFITKIGNGGAGPDYGIYSLEEEGEYSLDEVGNLSGASRPFSPHIMSEEEAENEDFEIDSDGLKQLQREGKLYCYDRDDEGDETYPNINDGFLVIGTEGCGHDYIIAVNGEYRGKIFMYFEDYPFYIFIAESFNQFYTDWLEEIS
jgi:hypothetical protein